MQGLAILLVVPALILQFALRPYWDKRVDLLDCVCCLSILLHLEANVYFNNAEYARTAQHGYMQGIARGCIPRGSQGAALGRTVGPLDELVGYTEVKVARKDLAVWSHRNGHVIACMPCGAYRVLHVAMCVSCIASQLAS